MRFKVYFTGLIWLFFTFSMVSQQNVLSKQESDTLREKIIEKSKNTSTIRSDFVQYKHLDFLSNDIKSSGNLVFKAPDMIKWEYQDPFNYIVIFKDKKLHINDGGTTSKIDLSSSKTFESLNGLIIKSVTGDMFDDDKFEMTYFHNEANYIIKFRPLDKALRSFINEFVLHFDKNSLDVIELKMIESSEDYTLINFLNQKFNESISNEVFNN